jgi:very-short-patch-repair endonuclease
LRLRGYKVDLQIGVSTFRIDLGVRHPDHPERFLAGIECDGAAYHSSKSARDRDRLREEMLTSFGWAILRVWSTDWFDNPDGETEKLAQKLEELRGRSPPSFESYPSLHVVTDIETTTGHGRDGATFEDRHETNESIEIAAVAPTATTNSTLPTPDLLPGDGSLTPEQGIHALERLRENVIRPAIQNWEAHRSILRPAMIETFVQQRISDPDEWYTRIPQYLRSGTNPLEKNQYLRAICEIVERIDAI